MWDKRIVYLTYNYLFGIFKIRFPRIVLGMRLRWSEEYIYSSLQDIYNTMNELELPNFMNNSVIGLILLEGFYAKRTSVDDSIQEIKRWFSEYPILDAQTNNGSRTIVSLLDKMKLIYENYNDGIDSNLNIRHIVSANIMSEDVVMRGVNEIKRYIDEDGYFLFAL